MLTDVVLHDQKVVAHIFLVHCLNSFRGILMLLEIYITIIKTLALSRVLLDDCCHNFAKSREHFTQLSITGTLGQVLHEDVGVDFCDARHIALGFTLV